MGGRADWKRGQAAADLLASYGIALILMAIVVAIIYQLTISNTYLFSTACTPAPGFSCSYYRLNTSGVLNLTFAQATGGDIVIKGASCSSAIAPVNALPAYGNSYVTNVITYYPLNNAPGAGITIGSGTGTSIKMYCYGSRGKAASTQYGTAFTGYVWFNYSVPGTSVNITQIVATLRTEYS